MEPAHQPGPLQIGLAGNLAAHGGKYLAATASFGIDVDGSVRKMLCDGCHSKSMTLPVVTICDSFGRIVYLSTGYNTSLGIQLKNVIDKL